MNPEEYSLGALPDRQDRRDKYKAAPPVDLPPSAEVDYLPAIQDQGQSNACTGYASAYFWEQVLVSRGMLSQRFSPLYPWYFSRRFEGSEMRNEGVTARGAMKSLHEFGTCPIEDWPENSPWFVEPNERSQIMGKALTLPSYERCESVREIKYAIAKEGQSCVLGVWVRSAWYETEAKESGRIRYDSAGIIEGGHMVTPVAYNDLFTIGNDIGAVKCANSWSTKYGNKGFIYLPYRLFESEPFDAWTVGFDAIPDKVG